MKIVLIRPPHVLPISSVTAQQGVPSLAIAYLSASLKKSGFNVECIDAIGEKIGVFRPFGVSGLLFAGLSVEEIISRIPKDADLIGVACGFSNDWIYTKNLLQQIGLYFPRCALIVGGEHASADYEEVLKSCPNIKACVIGEGEETLVELSHAIKEKRSIHSIPGIAYFDETVVKTQKRERIQKLDQLPWPDWDAVPLEKYLAAGLGFASQGIRSLPILASRGCPYHCTFCSAPQMWEADWQCRSVDDILAEGRYFKEKYNIELLEFYDMSPSINRRWFHELCSKLGNLNLKWHFPSGMRSEVLSSEFLENMKKNGCFKIIFALETSSLPLIKLLRKNVVPEKAFKLIRSSVSKKIITKVNFIWGIPNQKHRDVLRDYIFLIRLAWIGLHDATCFAFVPYPGSALFKELKEAGRIPIGEDYDRFLAFNVYNNPLRMRSWTSHISDRALRYYSFFGMALFYSVQFLIRPHRFLALIYRLARNRPLTMLELALHGLIKNFIKGKKLKGLFNKSLLSTTSSPSEA